MKNSQILWTALVALLLLCFGNSVGAARYPNSTEKPLFSINLVKYLHQHNNLAHIVSILNQNTFIMAESRFGEYSSINFWDMRTGKIASQLKLSSQIDADSVMVSQNGKILLALEDIVVIDPNSLYHPHNVMLWDMKTKKLIRKIDVGSSYSVHGAVFMPNSTNEALVSVGPLPVGIGHVLYVNLFSGKIEQDLKYDNSTLMKRNNVILSPNGKLMACVYPGGESGFNRIDFLEIGTGKMLFTLRGNLDTHFIDLPAFFLSSTQIVCNNFIFNIQTKQIVPLMRPHDTRLECVSDVPGRRGYAFFMAKQGLELWKLPADKMVRRWKMIKQVDHIYFAQDNSVMGVLDGDTLEIWPFDPRVN